MRYIDLRNAKAEKHYEAAQELIDQGYHYVYSTFGNPTFFKADDPEDDGTVTILSGIVTQEGFFSI